MKAGILSERIRAIGHRRVTQILQAMERGQLQLEVALQIGPRIIRLPALRDVNA